MVPEKERLAIEMGAKRLRVDVQKAARCGRLAGGRAVQETHFRVIYGLHVFASFIPLNSERPKAPASWRGNRPFCLRKTSSGSGGSSIARAAGPKPGARPALRRRSRRS